MTTWKEELDAAFNANYGESWESVEDYYPEDLDFDRKFDGGFGIEEGIPFYLWTKNRVYFVCTYDGAEWVSSVPRRPTRETPKSFGGG